MRRAFQLTLVIMLGVASFSQQGLCQSSIPRTRFGDSGYVPPLQEGYKGRLFTLSQVYPSKEPDPQDAPGFLSIDFQTSWREYVMAARDYCFDGNITAKCVEDDFDVATLQPKRWFHMPWQHYGKNGREGIHGLTKEARIRPGQLAASQHSKGQTYAVAFYNEYGGHQIWQVWGGDRAEPRNLKKIKFPVGTVVFKLLFADIPLAEVPYLVPPLEWRAYVTETYDSQKRTQKMLALIQMDIMVRDARAPHGWVFATFQYNGAQGRLNRWENLVPIGIQWGNDPEAKEDFVNSELKRTIRNPKLKETIINPDDSELPPTHLGWNGRLNGPVDNPQSSCMSCHAVAQVIEKSPLGPMFLADPPAPGSDLWMRWFKNYKCGEEFDEGVPSADFSLQLAVSLQNFRKWRGEGQGVVASKYERQTARDSRQPAKETETVIESGVPTEEPQLTRDPQ